MRVWFSGRTDASQASGGGSIPPTRTRRMGYVKESHADRLTGVLYFTNKSTK